MAEIGAALRKKRENLGWSQTKLATMAGTTAATVSRIETGRSYYSQATLVGLLRAMGTTLEAFYLTLGSGNVEPASTGGRRVPVLDYVQAAKWPNIASRIDKQMQETILTDLDNPPSTFALRILGDSMEPDFHAGDIVVVSPALMPRPGDFVVAAEAGKESTFRRYKMVGKNEQGEDVFELQPLNPLYAAMRSDRHDLSLVGVMVEHRRFRRP
jgi:SOS-response transcriptional repressor LexA